MPPDTDIILVRRTAISMKLSELTLSHEPVIQPVVDCLGCGAHIQPLYHDAQFCCLCRAAYVKTVMAAR